MIAAKKPQTLLGWLVLAAAVEFYAMIGLAVLIGMAAWAGHAIWGRVDSEAERGRYAAADFRRRCRWEGLAPTDFVGPRRAVDGDALVFTWAKRDDPEKTITVTDSPDDIEVRESEKLSREIESGAGL